MPLPTGRWIININGREMELVIQQVVEGVFSSILSQAEPGAPPAELKQTGFWDEVSQTITFGLTEPSGDMPAVAVFKGYLLRSPENPAPGRDVVATLAGSVQVTLGAFPGLPLLSSSRRNVFGWFAQITEVI